MKNEVVVNGVTLTRAQIEGALKELNATPPRPVIHGRRFLQRKIDYPSGPDSFGGNNAHGTEIIVMKMPQQGLVDLDHCEFCLNRVKDFAANPGGRLLFIEKDGHVGTATPEQLAEALK